MIFTQQSTDIMVLILRMQCARLALYRSTAYAGATIQWLRDNLGLIQSASDCDDIMCNTIDNGGVYFVPAFAGLFAPSWRSDARGVISG